MGMGLLPAASVALSTAFAPALHDIGLSIAAGAPGGAVACAPAGDHLFGSTLPFVLSEHDELVKLRSELEAFRSQRARDAAQAAQLQAHYTHAAAEAAGHAEQRERLGAECERLAAEGRLLKQAFLIQGRRARELEQRLGDADAARKELASVVQRLEKDKYVMSVQLAQQDMALRQAAAAGGMRFYGGGPDAGLG